jgi:hypothetical protein
MAKIKKGWENLDLGWQNLGWQMKMWLPRYWERSKFWRRLIQESKTIECHLNSEGMVERVKIDDRTLMIKEDQYCDLMAYWEQTHSNVKVEVQETDDGVSNVKVFSCMAELAREEGWFGKRVNANVAVDRDDLEYDEYCDELEREVFKSNPSDKVCRYCGEGGLRWENIKGKWRLFDGNEIHRCPVNPLKDTPPKLDNGVSNVSRSFPSVSMAELSSVMEAVKRSMESKIWTGERVNADVEVDRSNLRYDVKTEPKSKLKRKFNFEL